MDSKTLPANVRYKELVWVVNLIKEFTGINNKPKEKTAATATAFLASISYHLRLPLLSL